MSGNWLPAPIKLPNTNRSRSNVYLQRYRKGRKEDEEGREGSVGTRQATCLQMLARAGGSHVLRIPLA